MYASMGCEERPKRRELGAHLEKEVASHLQLLHEKMSKLQQTQNLPPLCQADKALQDLFGRVVALEQGFRQLSIQMEEAHRRPPQFSTGGQFVWRVQHFKSKLEEMRNQHHIYSEPFFTGPVLGYKACVRCNYNKKGPDEYFGIFVHFMSSKDDDILDWPFRGRIELRLKNRSGPDLIERLHSQDNLSAFERPPNGARRNPVGFGFPEFICISEILSNGHWDPAKDDLVILARLLPTQD